MRAAAGSLLNLPASGKRRIGPVSRHCTQAPTDSAVPMSFMLATVPPHAIGIVVLLASIKLHNW